MSGSTPPDSTCHAFVLQSQSSLCLYGVALRLWVKIDAKRRERIFEVLSPNATGLASNDTTTWMPYCLSYLSHYPLYDLMSDYLRCTWMLYGKDPDKFNTEGVMRLTRIPPPRPEQFLQIELEKYTLYYKLPADPNKFQNFALWPMFCCMSVQQIVAVIEAALCPNGRIIFTSQHPAILTNVAESVRFYVKTWAGLYVPVVYGRQAQEHIDEPAPYILGVTKQSRSLFTAPREALLVDLDFQRIFTSRPPGSLSPRQRKKYANMISKVLGAVKTDGVPPHLRSAYDENSQFNAVGAVVGSDKAVKDPSWWDPVQTEAVMTHISRRIRQNYKLLATLNLKQQSTKVSARDLAGMAHNRNFLSRSVDEAWQAYIKFKRRSDVKVLDLLKRETSLEADLQTQKKEYTELSECTEALVDETGQLQTRVNQQMRENVGLGSQLRDKALHAKQLSNHVSELQSELKEAQKTLSVQQGLLDEIERSRNNSRASKSEMEHRCLLLTQERDEAHRAVIHLTSLISSQITYIERVISSLLVTQPPRPSSAQENRKSVRRSFQSLNPNSPGLSPILSQFPLLKPEHETTPDSKRHTTDFSQSVVNPLAAAIAAHAAQVRSGSSLSQSELPEDEPSIRDKVGAVASTVQKINDQCRAAIQDLADKRTEINARANTPPRPQSPPGKVASTGSLRSSSAPPTMVPSAISRLIEGSRNEARGGDDMSLASSQLSKATQLTGTTSVVSSVPSLASMTSTILSDSVSESFDGPSQNTQEAKNAVRIQPIPEEEEIEGDNFVDAEQSPSKVTHFRQSSGVLGRAIFG